VLGSRVAFETYLSKGLGLIREYPSFLFFMNVELLFRSLFHCNSTLLIFFFFCFLNGLYFFFFFENDRITLLIRSIVSYFLFYLDEFLEKVGVSVILGFVYGVLSLNSSTLIALSSSSYSLSAKFE